MASPDQPAESVSDRPKSGRAKAVAVAPPPPAPFKVFFDRHGNKILLGITVVLLFVFAIRFRMQTTRDAAERAAGNLTAARQALADFKARPYWQAAVEQYATERRSLASAVEESVNNVLADSDDPKLRADALLVRGDLNWLLANQPELPGAATQPALQLLQPADAHLRAAQEAYEQVLASHADLPIAANAARTSLAAVFENRRDWDAARKQYDGVIADVNAPKSLRDLATTRLGLLDQLRQPLYLSPATTQSGVPFLPQPATTLPTTAPGAVLSVTVPTTAPAGR